MKIQNNSALFPSYSIEQLNQERQSLSQARQTAVTTGNDTTGIDELIQKVTRELQRRNGEKVPTEEEIEQAKTAAEQFLQAQAAVPEDQKVHINSSKFDGPIGVLTLDENSARKLIGDRLGINVYDNNSEKVILTTKTYPDGWLFVVNNRDYVENGNRNANLRGGGQYLVASNGDIRSVGSGTDFGLVIESLTVHEATTKLQSFITDINDNRIINAVKASVIELVGKDNVDYAALSASRAENEPDLWLVSVDIQDDNDMPRIGAGAWVVDKNGRVFTSSGSYPPSKRIEDAKNAAPDQWYQSSFSPIK